MPKTSVEISISSSAGNYIYDTEEKEKSEYLKINNEEITLAQLESKLKVSRYELILALESNCSPLSIEKEYENDKDSGFSLESIISDTNKDITLDLLTLLDAIKTLTEKEKIIIDLRFYNDYSQKQVADKFNVSQVQISRMEKKIIEKLKKQFV